DHVQHLVVDLALELLLGEADLADRTPDLPDPRVVLPRTGDLGERVGCPLAHEQVRVGVGEPDVALKRRDDLPLAAYESLDRVGQVGEPPATHRRAAPIAVA